MPRGVYKRKDEPEQPKEKQILINLLVTSIQNQLDILKDLING